jgi:hypothetical protein
MPNKTEIIEDFLSQIEEHFYATLKSETFPNYFGGSVRIVFSTAPRVAIEITEAKRPGPKMGSKNRPHIGPSKRAMNEAGDTEGF